MTESEDAHIRELMELKFQLRDKALDLQAAETERRLTALNGEADRLRKMQESYVPRETYYSEKDKFSKDVEGIDKEMDELKAWKNNAAGRQSVITVVVSSAISLAFWLLTRFIKP